MDYKEKLEIDLSDLLQTVIKKWKAILVCIIAGMILGGAYGYILSGKEYNTTTHQYAELEDKYGIVDARNVLTNASALWVEEEVINSLRQKELVTSFLKENKNIVYLSGGYSDYAYMTIDERVYYQALYADIVSLMREKGITKVDDWMISIDADEYTYAKSIIEALTDSNDVVIVRSFSLKFMIFGGVIGAFMIMLMLALTYILSPVLKTVDDLESAFGLPILGEVSNDRDTRTVVLNILTASKRASFKTLVLCGSSESADNETIKDRLVKEVADSNINMINGQSMLSSVTAIEAVLNSDAVVLIERIGVSKYVDIARELDLCNSFGIKVLGVIVAVD